MEYNALIFELISEFVGKSKSSQGRSAGKLSVEPHWGLYQEITSEPVKEVGYLPSRERDEDLNDIRVKPDLDALGALGDVGWYCIRSILWAANYELPKTVIALPGPVSNKAGVLLSCGSSLVWEDGKIATFHGSFLSHLTMELCVIGTKGTLRVSDFVVPFDEPSASFTFASDACFTELVTGWQHLAGNHIVNTDLPQEARMVTEFSRLVRSIKDSASKPDKRCPNVTRKTQLVLDAVKASIENGFQPVDIIS
ncbi:hypothetical protein Taro_036283 [Colocasia esculenta]|uniref:GFO/IDH/MocA-like oxidoreductase domain-containing protein n=1 Tax=Colocasia esculenta TaxID=4460 RepID=A0A843W162_COLES|nr:hypothetical protein [Colocasia esculenta]